MNNGERHWYIVHTYAGYEDRVEGALKQRIKYMDAENKIFQVVVPKEDEIEIRSGQRRTVTKKMFPGYVLVQMKLDDEEFKRGLASAQRLRWWLHQTFPDAGPHSERN